MNYEYLIRKAYNCGRHGVIGANADIYRRYQRDLNLYNASIKEIENKESRSWLKEIKLMAFEVSMRSGLIIAYIKMALNHVRKEFEDEIDIKRFDLLISKLSVPTKENIDEVIKEAHIIFNELELKVG